MKRILLIPGALALSFLLFSCQSAPEAAPQEQAPEAPPAEEEAPLPDERRVRADELRDLIMQYELGQYAEAEFATGEEAYSSAEDAYGEDNVVATELYEEAIDNYGVVIQRGVVELQSDWENQIEQLDAEATELRAARAVPADYEQARETLEDARGAVDEAEWDAAATLYGQALERHRSVVDQTREKRGRALEALEQIDAEIQSTESDIQELEREQQEFDPEAEDLVEDES